jgi:hypothetical protein
MTKEQLSAAIRKIIEGSGLSVTITATIRDGDATFARMLSAGENPPGPANPFTPSELRELLSKSEEPLR